jgi:hypothetical protein
MHQSIWKILEEYPDKIVDIVKQGVDVSVAFVYACFFLEAYFLSC